MTERPDIELHSTQGVGPADFVQLRAELVRLGAPNQGVIAREQRLAPFTRHAVSPPVPDLPHPTGLSPRRS